LIRASDGVHLWSEIYDRKLTDIFKVQDEISRTVAKALNAALNLTLAVGGPSASRGTTNIAAYNLLLQGNYFFWRGDKGDNGKAAEYFLQALKRDPHYAPAWAKLARVYAWQGYVGELTAAEGALKGREAAERALALDANCAEAYYARANISRLIAGDWAGSISDNERAAALDPHGEVGDNARANILSVRVATEGRFDDAIDWARERLSRDPLDKETMMDLAYFEQGAGHLEESAATFQRVLEQNPDYVGANGQYAVTLLLMGKKSEALAAAQKESDEANRFLALDCVYWALGRRAESDSALAALERGFADRRAYEIAAAHACRGEADAGFAWLDRAYQQSKGTLGLLRSDSLIRKLRNDPRFDALLRKAKLVE
jgi:tetratricopeptide (TPR) repeat protein